MREYVSHPAFDETRKNYMMFAPNKKGSSMSEGALDNLRKEERLTVGSDAIRPVAAYLLNFRNNLVAYSRLAQVLQQRQFSRVLVFLLVKRHLQNLTAVLHFLKEGQFPTVLGFQQLTLPADSFATFLKSPLFGQLCAVYVSDVRGLSQRYAQAFKDVLNATRAEADLPSFDLNVVYKKEIVSSCRLLSDKVRYILSIKQSPELERISNLLQLVLLYEGTEEQRAVIAFNKSD